MHLRVTVVVCVCVCVCVCMYSSILPYGDFLFFVKQLLPKATIFASKFTGDVSAILVAFMQLCVHFDLTIR